MAVTKKGHLKVLKGAKAKAPQSKTPSDRLEAKCSESEELGRKLDALVIEFTDKVKKVGEDTGIILSVAVKIQPSEIKSL